MVGSLTLAGLACVLASILFVFIPVGLSNEGALITALALVVVGVAAGLAAVVRRQRFGLLPVALGVVFAVWYVALYDH